MSAAEVEVNDNDLERCLEMIRICTQKLDWTMSTECRLLQAEVENNNKSTEEICEKLEEILDLKEHKWQRTIENEMRSWKQELASFQQKGNKSVSAASQTSKQSHINISSGAADLETINAKMHADLERRSFVERLARKHRQEKSHDNRCIYGVTELTAGFKQMLRCTKTLLRSLDELKSRKHVLKAPNNIENNEVWLFATRLRGLFRKIQIKMNELSHLNERSD